MTRFVSACTRHHGKNSKHAAGSISTTRRKQVCIPRRKVSMKRVRPTGRCAAGRRHTRRRTHSRYRPAVDGALRNLRNYVTAVYAGGHPTAPEGFLISKHAAKSEPWLELRADDRAFAEAIVTCLDLPDISGKELTARGLSGANYPSFNYAPSLGFYRSLVVLDLKK